MISANNKAVEIGSKLDTIVFDMDGVLLDISGSMRAVNSLAVSFFLREVIGLGVPDDLVTTTDVENFKHAGGFNDDWDLTYALVLHYLVKHHENPDTDGATLNVTGMNLNRYAHRTGDRGGGLAIAEEICLGKFLPRDRAAIERMYDKTAIRQVFQEMLAGDLCERMYGRSCTRYHGKGYIYNDRCLIDHSLIPSNVKLGIQTGRTYEEAVVGMEFAHLDGQIPQEHVITKRDGFHKPDPGGLALLANRLGTETGGIYIGDTLDDLRTVRALNEKGSTPPFICALVLTGPAGNANLSLFKRNQPDVLCSDVNEVLKWIREAQP